MTKTPGLCHFLSQKLLRVFAKINTQLQSITKQTFQKAQYSNVNNLCVSEKRLHYSTQRRNCQRQIILTAASPSKMTLRQMTEWSCFQLRFLRHIQSVWLWLDILNLKDKSPTVIKQQSVFKSKSFVVGLAKESRKSCR